MTAELEGTGDEVPTLSNCLAYGEFTTSSGRVADMSVISTIVGD